MVLRHEALGLEAQVLGGQQQVVRLQEFIGGPSELVCKSGRVSGDLVQAGDGAQRQQRRIRRSDLGGISRPICIVRFGVLGRRLPIRVV